jgi:hypothetical protein
MLKNQFGNLALLVLLSGSGWLRPACAQTAAQRLVEVENIIVSGTRLPSESIIKLSGIKPHDKVNDLIVNSACHKITATGLIKNVAYFYDAYPDRPEVVLNLTITDEAPLVPAVVKPAAEEWLWTCMQAQDGIFKRDLPPTEKALAFYSKGFEACLQTKGRTDEYAGSTVTADAGGAVSSVVFEIRRYKGVPQK